MNSGLYFVIPAYNEARSIGRVVRQTLSAFPGSSVIVVNDGSYDGTVAAAGEAGAVVVNLPFNCGYGTALHTGLSLAKRRGAMLVVTLDADGQHDPAEARRLLAPVVHGEVDIALGSRYLDRGARYRVPWARRIGATLFAAVLSAFTRHRFTDPTTGFQCMGARALDVITNLPDFPEMYPDADVILYAHGKGLRIVEIPVAMYADESGDSMHGLWKSLFYAPRMLTAMLGVFFAREV